MRLVLGNATILRGEELEPTKGFLVIKDGLIEEVGEGKGPRGWIDLKRGIVSPTFTNAHVHLGDSIGQDYGAYKNIEKRVGTGGLKGRLLEEGKARVPAGMGDSMRRMLRCGTGAFGDFREGGLEGVRLLRRVMDPRLEGVVLGRPDGSGVEELLAECDGIGLRTPRAYPKVEIERIVAAVKGRKKLLAVHAAEVRDDVDEALGLRPDFLVHLTNARRESLDKVARAGVPVVLCPRANAMLGVGLPEIPRLLERTLVALGTDNVMVNGPNMMREAEFAFKLARGMGRDPTLDGKSILAAATINGRKVLGLRSNAIEGGNKASFIVFRRGRYLYDPVLAVIHRYDVGDIRCIVRGDDVSGGSLHV